MRICQDHWKMIRDVLKDRGMDHLGAKSGKEAMDQMINDLQAGKGSQDPKDFDPNMSLHWHFTNEALRCGGLYLMFAKPDGGDYCPVCEFVKNVEGFEAKKEIENIADQMLEYCRENGLVAKVQ